jgi:hypothetical protein
VAWQYCSVCDPCDEWHRIKPEDSWEGVSPYAFCEFVLAYQEACGQCLEEWWGGGG